ncbi:23S rRNA methyltransferase [Achromatium sp. WMS3]|nr:23S rRNA methyltransferase [Achromatium sp. WMS3]
MIGGIHVVRTMLACNSKSIRAVWYDRANRNKRVTELLELATELQVPIQDTDRKTLDQTIKTQHQGIAVHIKTPLPWTEAALYELLEKIKQRAEQPFLLILDEVQDPHNLGACLRTAEAAGVHAVIAPKTNSARLTPIVCKVASGAADRIPYVQVTNLARTLKQLKAQKLWLVGATIETSTKLYQADLQGPIAILLGNEAKGLRQLTRKHCDYLISLPMLGVLESLNVSVAAGIVLYEVVRQRMF